MKKIFVLATAAVMVFGLSLSGCEQKKAEQQKTEQQPGDAGQAPAQKPAHGC